MNVLRRAMPAIVLLLLSPLVAEFLLGDLNLAQLPALVALAPFYGGGAILIREALRHTRRSWPSFLLLAFAYALVEEAIADQSLFNPDYLHLRLLDYGWIPGLGIALPWTLFVLGIHVVWSLAVPIGLTESFFGDRRTEPWLGRIGLVVVALLYCLGFALVMNFSLGHTPFRASLVQLGVSGLLALASIAAAFLLFERGDPAKPAPTQRPLSPLPIAAFSLVAGAAFLLSYALGRGTFHWPWPLTVAAGLAAAAAMFAFFAWANRGRAWTARQSWAAAFGGMLCYAVFGYQVDRDLHGPSGAAEHSIFVIIVLAFALWAGVRAARFTRSD